MALVLFLGKYNNIFIYLLEKLLISSRLFGAGKGILTQAITKWSNSDIVVFVGCGERGTELAEIMMELPELTLPGVIILN